MPADRGAGKMPALQFACAPALRLGIHGLMRRTLLGLLALLSSAALAQQPITITILHTNDLHAHAEPVTLARKPYGGYARQATLIKKFRASDPNPLLLNGGDTFQGTLYFNVYEGLAEAAFMNMVGYQAMAVGNHEFDRGPATLGAFAKVAKFPLLAANLDVSAEPTLVGKVKATAVLEVGGQKVGIVGAITPDLPSISSPGPNVRMLDLRTSVQKAVDELVAQGLNKIVMVSHVGLSGERELAKNIKGLDFIVGGHSHSLLGSNLPASFPHPAGEYPIAVDNASGSKCLIVSSWEWGKVFGRIKVEFDAQGRIVKWHDAAPIVVDETIPEDQDVASLIAALQKPLANLQSEEIGSTDTGLGHPSDGGRGYDSTIANVITDAMLVAAKAFGAVAALTNQGGIRASIEPGKITYGTAIGVLPFSNTLMILELSGSELKAALEHGADRTGGLLHPSGGMSYRLDMSRPVGQRVSEIMIGSSPIEPSKTYKIAFNNFTASGGDGHEVLKNAKGTRLDTGLVDIDYFVAFIKANSPLNRKLENRIVQASAERFGVRRPGAAMEFPIYELGGTMALRSHS
jgi:5'-nucleotidase/UDP-sugar diphosphatase